MSTGLKIKLVLYAPKTTGAVAQLEKIRAGLPAGEVTELADLPLDIPGAKTFDYNSKMQLKGQTLEWKLSAADGQVHAADARQTLLKGAHGILFWGEAADVASLQSMLVGDFDQVAGRNFALVHVGAQVPADAEPPAMLKELMKAALKVAAAAM